MYKCHECNKNVGPKVPCNKVVVETRKKVYNCRPKIYPGKYTRNGVAKVSNKRSDRKDDPGGEGWEIVQEVFVCPECLKSS